MPKRRKRGRKMKVKIIPIILLLLISIATPVVVSMAIPKGADEFYVMAELKPLDPHFLDETTRGVQKYTQDGTFIDGNDKTGTIELDILITNFVEAFTDKYARARVHFIMDFDDEERADIRGTIVGKIWFVDGVQHVDGIFVGKGSHVKGTVRMIGIPDVLIFEGMEW